MPRLTRERVDDHMNGRLTYDFGNEHDPGNPFGRSALTIDPDGAARLEHYPNPRLATPRAWTGRVDRGALEQLWSALARAGFPAVPAVEQQVVPGATMRILAIDDDSPTGEGHRAALVEWRAATRLPGYDVAFALLDAIVLQLSEHTVGGLSDGAPPIVDAVARER